MIVLWRKGELPRIDANLCFFVVLPIVLLQAFFSGLLTSFVLLCAFLVVILSLFRISKFLAIWPPTRVICYRNLPRHRGVPCPHLG